MPLRAEPELYWRAQALQLRRLRRAHFRALERRRRRSLIGRLLGWALARLRSRPAH